MKSFRNKLNTCALLVLSLGGVADAAQLIVFEAPLDSRGQEVSADFEVNRELGRAWIDVRVDSINQGEEPPGYEVISKAVEGLYYDRDRKQVLYRTGTETIVCAEDAKFLWRTYLKSTGQCLLTPLSEQRKMDDGFKIREQAVAKVVFEVQPENAVLAQQLNDAEISLEQGLVASTAEGKPISAKFELEDGKLQLSVYVAKGAFFREVIVDHKSGKIAKAEAITVGGDLAAATAQGDAMARAKTSLQGALAKAVAANQPFRAVSVTSALENGRPMAYITLMKGEHSKTIGERLD